MAGSGRWLIRLIQWDGLLPLTIWLLPYLIRLMFPNNRGAIELMAIALPIAALFGRYQNGVRTIAANGNDVVWRRFQLGVFCLGILLMVLLDAIAILCHLMPNGTFSNTDIMIAGVMYAIYLAAMVFSLYERRLETSAEKTS